MKLTAPPRLLLVHAHPDDESLWTGGTIAWYAAHGVRVTVVTCTLGEEGEIIPPGLALLASDSSDQLGGYRVGELRSACAALGITDHRFLGGIGRWRDSGMAGTPSNTHPRSFLRGDAGEQAAALAELITELRPQVVLSYDSYGGYGHPDHIRAHEIAMAATEGRQEVARVFHVVTSAAATERGVAEIAGLAEMPFRLPEPGELPVTADEKITTVIDISDHVSAKLNALRAHATQVSVWQDGHGSAAYALSNGIAQPVADTEHYVLARGISCGAERDLFGGLGLPHIDGGQAR
ncbi:MAG: N-acetyl-1-D-myo-inositol-2-amino-2-deoxy-alpha-D-glucopyranoside deacetylase [Sciscionella sp.]